jgi:hypothetical protein
MLLHANFDVPATPDAFRKTQKLKSTIDSETSGGCPSCGWQQSKSALQSCRFPKERHVLFFVAAHFQSKGTQRSTEKPAPAEFRKPATLESSQSSNDSSVPMAFGKDQDATGTGKKRKASQAKHMNEVKAAKVSVPAAAAAAEEQQPKEKRR